MNDKQAELMIFINALLKVKANISSWVNQEGVVMLNKIAVPQALKVPLATIVSTARSVYSAHNGKVNAKHRRYIKSKTGCTVSLTTDVDGTITGGILTIEGHTLEFGE